MPKGWVQMCAAMVLVVTFGCGQSAQRTKPASKRTQAASVPLPEWAPKNPSPEFLRAAKVLRGVPTDAVGRGDMPEQSWRALLEYMRRVNPTLWRLFGSLTDAQIGSFLAAKRISIPARDLTPVQAAALDAVVDANKGSGREIAGVSLPDFRTLLYKMGASQDLSNVTIGFAIEGANTLSFNAHVAGTKAPLQWTGWAQVPRLGPNTPMEKSRHQPPASTSELPLPEWAPRNPSPEFRRAAKVLKPTPPEALGAGSGDPAKRASAERRMRIMPAAWEFFGSLTDAQIKTFQTKREVRLPVKSLTAKQRAAFDHWLEVYRQTNRGQRPPEFKDHEDLLVLIYKSGAKQDLSNVEVGFSAPEGHVVYANFWIRQPDGTLAHMSVGSFGQI